MRDRETCPRAKNGAPCDNYDCREFDPDCAREYRDMLRDEAVDARIDARKESPGWIARYRCDDIGRAIIEKQEGAGL